MKKFMGDNDPTLSPKSVFSTIRKRYFKNNTKEPTHRNEEIHENIGDWEGLILILF